jgi:uncharacterized membrane protein (DUF373 family)
MHASRRQTGGRDPGRGTGFEGAHGRTESEVVQRGGRRLDATLDVGTALGTSGGGPVAQTTTGGDEVALSGEVAGRGQPARPQGRWLSRVASEWIEHAQDIVSAAVAVAIVLLAGGILVASVVDFASSVHRAGLTSAASVFVDKVLLVLILVEIVHTVVLSLRAHALVAQPFVVVGLIAVIRKILFVLSGQQKLSTTSLGLYIGMVAVFVAALVAIEMLNRRRTSSAELEEPFSELG